MKKIGKRQLKKFKEHFISLRQEIINNLSKVVDLPDIDGDDIDIVQGVILNSINTKLSDRDKKRLDVINEALSKIDNGTFGECEECGELIHEKRLMALPESKVCISCAEELEIMSKTYAPK